MSIKLSNHKLKFISLISGIVFLITSCKKEDYPVEKDTLSGDTAIFIGMWNWIYSEHDYNWCDPPASYEIITPLSANSDYRINFDEIGIVSLFKNDSLIAEHRVEVVQFIDDDICLLTNAFKFNIDLSIKDNLNFNGCINEDTLRLGSFPGFLFQAEPGCENYQNYFLKE